MNNPEEQLFLIREGELGSRDLKKKDLWTLLKLLIDHPMAGMPIGSPSLDEKIEEEETRLAKIFFSDEVDPQIVLDKIMEDLSYYTLMVLYSWAKGCLVQCADSANLISTNAGAFQTLCDDMDKLSSTAKGDPARSEEKVQLNVVLMAKIVTLLAEMSSFGQDLYDRAEGSRQLH